jgi:hypothetical protein
MACPPDDRLRVTAIAAAARRKENIKSPVWKERKERGKKRWWKGKEEGSARQRARQVIMGFYHLMVVVVWVWSFGQFRLSAQCPEPMSLAGTC